MSGNVKYFERPIVTEVDPLAASESEIHLTRPPCIGGWVRVETHLMLLLEEVVSDVIESARALHQYSVRFTASEERPRRGALDCSIAALVVHIRMRSHGEGKRLGFQPKFFHIRKDDLLGSLSNAGIDQHDVVPDEKVLEEVSISKE
jgi:hypothetical protein